MESTEHYLLSREEAAERYGMSTRSLDRLCKGEPTFPVAKIGRRVLIHRDRADKWFSEYYNDGQK